MAKKYEWREEYSVGDDLIDSQHRRFFELANQLMETAAQPYILREQVEEHVLALANYAYHHFATEEQRLLLPECDNSEAHVSVHNSFRAEVMRRISEIRSRTIGNALLASELADYAGEWLVNHILKIDKSYARCFAFRVSPSGK